MTRNGRIGAFSHIAKTGGLQVAQLLQQYHGLRHLAVEPKHGHLYSAEDLTFDLRAHRHVISIAGHSLRPHIDYGSLHGRLAWYTMLRNPVDRYLSHFMHEVTHGGKANDLARWMQESPRSNFQVRMLAGEEDLAAAVTNLERMAAVGLLERLPASLAIMRQALGWPGLDISCARGVNVSSPARRSETRMMAERHMDDIRAHNALDLQLYEHAVQVLWPQQVERFGGEAKLDAELEAEAPHGPALSKRWRRMTYLGYRRLIHLPVAQLRRSCSR